MIDAHAESSGRTSGQKSSQVTGVNLDKLRSLGGPIAFASYTKEGDIGGVTSWLEALVMRLHGDGVPVVLLLLCYGSKIPAVGFWEALRDAGIPVEIELVSIEAEAASPRSYVDSILAFLNRHRPRLFLPNCRSVLYFAARIAGKRGLPWVFTVHSDDPLFWNVAQSVGVRSCHGFYVAVSQHIADLLIDKGLDVQPQLIPYGVPFSDKTALFSESPFRVCYTGRIVEEQKRISLILQAMAHACRADSRVECWLIGDGPEAASAKLWVSQQQLADRIHFAGRLDVGEVRRRICEYQVILLMSDYEGLGISLLEAMACSVVPVVRGISPVTEFVKQERTGLLVDSDPEQAAKAILRLLDEPDLWLRCARGSRSAVEEGYSEETSYRRWVDFLASLAGQSAIDYPLKVTPFLPIPLRYEPLLRRFATVATGLKWRMIGLWYRRILPALLIPRRWLRLLLGSIDS